MAIVSINSIRMKSNGINLNYWLINISLSGQSTRDTCFNYLQHITLQRTRPEEYAIYSVYRLLATLTYIASENTIHSSCLEKDDCASMNSIKMPSSGINSVKLIFGL